VGARGHRLRLVDVGQDTAAVFRKTRACVGDPHDAGGAGEQAQAQPFFQFRDRPRHHRRRQVELRAALAKPPLSTTATKVVMACRRSILFPIQKVCLG